MDEEQLYVIFLLIQEKYSCLYNFYKNDIDFFIDNVLENIDQYDTVEIDYFDHYYKQNINQDVHETNEIIRANRYNDNEYEQLEQSIEELLEIKNVKILNNSLLTTEFLESNKIGIVKNIMQESNTNVESKSSNVYSDASFTLLLQYQQLIIDRVEHMYNSEYIDAIFIDAPTGFGETFMMIQVIEQLQLKNILFMSPRLMINKEFDEQSEELQECSIKICCYESWHKYYSDQYDLVIFDEAHYSLNHFIYDNFEECEEILLSATPLFLPPNIQPLSYELEFLNVEHLISISILANLIMYIKNYESNVDYFNELVDQHAIECQYNTIQTMIEEFHFNEGVIYFSQQEFCEEFYHAYHGSYEEFIAISEIESNDIEEFVEFDNECIMITCEQIDMGFDCNEIDMICFGSAYQTEHNIEQMIGRGLRQYNSKVLKIIIPVVESDIEFKEYDKIETVIETMIKMELDDKIKFDENTSVGEYVQESLETVELLLESNVISLAEYTELLHDYNIKTPQQYIDQTEKYNLYDYNDLEKIYEIDFAKIILREYNINL